jgi:hypothetical protein
MRFKNGSHYGGHFGSYFQYGRQNTYKISKCSNAPITKNIDISICYIEVLPFIDSDLLYRGAAL